MIDFTELSRDGTDFELLIRDLFQRQGLEVYWSGKGPDGGKDLICIERIASALKPSVKRWVVQCKHNAHSGSSVGKDDIIDIRDTCEANKAAGYMLACTTQPSSSLISKFDSLESNTNISIAFWDGRKIEHELMKPQNWDIAEQYFPQSVKASGWQINALSPRFWHAMYQNNIMYMAARLSSNPDMLTSDIERMLRILKSIRLPKGWILRLRAVYYDDKNCVYRVYLDLLVPNGEDGKIYETNVERLGRVLMHLEVIDGIMHDYDVLVYAYWGYSDHFDIDHHDYYDAYLKIFEGGYDRADFPRSNVTVLNTTEEQDSLYTEEYVNSEFDKLLEVLRKLDFIRILNARNARIELIDQFSEYFEWQELIEKSDYAADNFFEVCFRLECLDFEKFQTFISILPVDIENYINLRKNYIVTPDKGLELEEDDIYTLGFVLLQVGIKSKKQYRRLLNRYMREIRPGRKFCVK